ncbi:hypothetical protein PAPYR_477 [Paratrimastix pyriformis]|uniref:Uncharacterized protein n=1 Tax=Paratrimastix pyriformis TaxID=342808 RepID=A0ABQ8UTP9_9EUKA|nr:hypothetical protein PAPYR_477 [Paratrimastix pyriformis]|eukprot:EC833256.1.p2 GENE.EC833256.1~~EC833256.1.p2  ORF type:complete len:104 (+),score=0.77 EC833256.1:32-343(+)
MEDFDEFVDLPEEDDDADFGEDHTACIIEPEDEFGDDCHILPPRWIYCLLSGVLVPSNPSIVPDAVRHFLPTLLCVPFILPPGPLAHQQALHDSDKQLVARRI